MRAVLAGGALQFALARRRPAEFAWLFVAPLYAVIFLSVVRHAARDDLAGYAVLGPAVMALIGTAIVTAGGLVDVDRAEGVLELQVAAPLSFSAVLVGRVLAVSAVALLSVAESWLVAGLGFGLWVAVPHLTVFLGTLLLTVITTAGVSVCMGALCVLTRAARLFQNSLSFPLFVLGGALVPVDVLPGAVRPLTWLVYLSWATDLLRDSLVVGPVHDVARRWAVIVLLGAVVLVTGLGLVRLVLRRVRILGSLGYA